MWESSNGNMRIWKPVGIEDVGLRVGKEQKRKKFADGDQWEITEFSLERGNLSGEKCKHQRRRMQSSNAQGKTVS